MKRLPTLALFAFLLLLFANLIFSVTSCKKNPSDDNTPKDTTTKPVADTVTVRGTALLDTTRNILLLTAGAENDVDVVNDSTLLVKDLARIKNAKDAYAGAKDVTNISVGDVVVSGRSSRFANGLLNKVAAVSRQGSNWLVGLAEEGLDKVFKQLDLDWNFQFDTTFQDGFSKDIPVGSGGVKLNLSGSYKVPVKGKLSLKIENGSLKNAAVSATADADLKAGSSLVYQPIVQKDTVIPLKEITLFQSNTINLGFVKFPIAVSASLKFSLVVTASGKMELSAEIENKNQSLLNFSYTQGLFPSLMGYVAKDLSDTTRYRSRITGTLKAGLLTELKLKFFKSKKVGVNAGLNVYGLVEGECKNGLDMKGTAGAEGTLGGEIDLFSQNTYAPSVKIFDYTKQIFHVNRPDNSFCPDAGPNPVDSGGATGDVHVITMDHQYYNQQACGEFTALASSYNNLLIQVRQGPTAWQTNKYVTFNRAIAVRSGTDVVSYQIEPEKIFVNGVETNVSTSVALDGRGYVARQNGIVVIQFTSGDRIRIRPHNGVGFFDYTVSLIAAHKQHISGLLGNWNGNATDDVVKNGMVINPNVDTAMYPGFPNALRILQAQSLFTYAAGESTVTFTDYTYPSGPLNPSISQLDAAQNACVTAGVTQQPALCNCIVDMVATNNNAAMAQSALFSQSNFASDGLIAYFPFNGNAKDSSQWKNDGTLSGGYNFIAGHNANSGSAISFNGVNGFVTIPNNPLLMSLTTTFTISGWMRISNWYNNFGSFCCKGLSNEPNPLQIEFTPSYIGSNGVDVTYSASLNTWFHVAMVYQNGTKTYYINGTPIGTKTETVTANTAPFDIGRDLYGAAEYLNGAIDEFRIYSRALSAAEILQLYQQ